MVEYDKDAWIKLKEVAEYFLDKIEYHWGTKTIQGMTPPSHTMSFQIVCNSSTPGLPMIHPVSIPKKDFSLSKEALFEKWKMDRDEQDRKASEEAQRIRDLEKIPEVQEYISLKKAANYPFGITMGYY